MQPRASRSLASIAWAVCILVALLPRALPAAEASALKIIPQKLVLHGPAARQQLLVEVWRANNFHGQVTNGNSWETSDPKIVRIVNGVALPVGDGAAKVVVKAGGQTATAEIAVEGMGQPFEWSFRNHVQPVLAKAGCSSGACHGAASGQNGFKLSLRGYDNEGDFLALTHQALGRRVIPSDPGRSLMLLKPTHAVPHKGGKRFDVNSIDYKVLSEWIAAGTPGPNASDPRIQSIAILPEQVFLEPGASQQLLVRATFSDGHTEDVTHWVKFNSANGSVAQVDDEGQVKVIGNGEGAITAWSLEPHCRGHHHRALHQRRCPTDLRPRAAP